MTEHLERLHEEDGYEFNATETHIRCMPHTIHLSALEVCFFSVTIAYFIDKSFNSCWNVLERSKMTRRTAQRRHIKTL